MYMRNYLRIMMEVSSIFLILSGTPENLAKKAGIVELRQGKG